MTPSPPWSTSATPAPSPRKPSRPQSRRTPKPPTTSNFSSAPPWPLSVSERPVVAPLLRPNQTPVISTEGGAFAAAAEKSASPPAPIPATTAPLHLSLPLLVLFHLTQNPSFRPKLLTVSP